MSPPAEPPPAAPAAPAGLLLGLVVAGLWLLFAGTAGADVDGDPDAGRELFAAHCAACHGQAGQGAGAAPALARVTERLGTELVARTIREGRDGMPDFGDRLDETQIGHLVAHLEKLPSDAAMDGPARSGGSMMHGRWRDMMGDRPAAFGLLWLAVVLVVVLLVVVGVVWLARWAAPPGSQRDPATSSSPAREILDERYARGEISREEYLQARRDLEDSG